MKIKDRILNLSIELKICLGIVALVVISCAVGTVLHVLEDVGRQMNTASRPEKHHFANKAEEMSWLVDQTSIRECERADERVKERSRFERDSNEDRYDRQLLWTCEYKTMKAHGSEFWNGLLNSWAKEPPDPDFRD